MKITLMESIQNPYYRALTLNMVLIVILVSMALLLGVARFYRFGGER